MKNDRILWAVLAVALATMNVVFIYKGLILEDHLISREGGPMENLQAILSGLASIVFFCTAVRDPASRLLSCGLALLCLTFVLREVDVDDPKLGVHYAIIYFIQGPGRNIFLTATWGWLFWKIGRNFKSALAQFCSFITTRSALLLLCATALLFAGVLFDKGVVKSRFQEFGEEIFECSGYFFVFAAALFHRPSQPQHVGWLARFAPRFFPAHFPPA